MINLKNIKKTYVMGENMVHALNDVSVHIGNDEFVSIVGPSGSGKSTLMNIIGCLDAADEGVYEFEGLNITDYTENQLSTLRNKKIGFIFQQFNLLMKLTAYENVELPLIYQGLSAAQRKEQVIEALEHVNLVDRMHHRPNELSGGQQQRVAIARALATRPSLILADEPTGNLDSHTGGDIMKLLKELHSQGNAIVLITHDNDVAKQAQRRIHIIDGKIDSDSMVGGGI
ncbi:MAG: ABC transporter ATP-binding protein [Eubacteriales bacterium]